MLDLSLAAEPAATLAALATRPAADASPYLGGWQRADALGRPRSPRSSNPTSRSRGSPPELGARLPANATLVVSASMPIRDVETFFPAREHPPRVLSNRGANGIDGVVSTAFGVAAGSAGPTVLLIGDVALAHDVGGLLAARACGWG